VCAVSGNQTGGDLRTRHQRKKVPATASRMNWLRRKRYAKLELVVAESSLPERGTSGSVQRGPANPARPGREQRYRVSQVCRGDSEVPRFLKKRSDIGNQIAANARLPALPEESESVIANTVCEIRNPFRQSWSRRVSSLARNDGDFFSDQAAVDKVF